MLHMKILSAEGVASEDQDVHPGSSGMTIAYIARMFFFSVSKKCEVWQWLCARRV